MGFWSHLFKGSGMDLEELARRLDIPLEQLRALRPQYREFTIPKFAGGTRRILAPAPELKTLQRRILTRILGRLKAHSAAHGFERKRSIVTNAAPHAEQAVVVSLDLKDFFSSTPAKRVRDYFAGIGWNRESTALLTGLCTHGGSLPQGAPTSPRLSNLLNVRLDARLAGLAARHGAAYTRYADDLTFSFGVDSHTAVHLLVRAAKAVIEDEGYRLHMKKKLAIRRSHQRQEVTGLVVNEGIALPREIRRWLRAMRHRAALGRESTLTPSQLEGWNSFEKMVRSRP